MVSSFDAYTGLCEIHGRIELRDFYYGSRYGWGDADTVKINMKTRSIRFKENDNAEWKQYPNIFDEAYVNDIEYKVIQRGKMDVRLQGIDAPELHISFNSSRLDLNLTPEQQDRLRRWENVQFRQYYSASSTYHLEPIPKLSLYTR